MFLLLSNLSFLRVPAGIDSILFLANVLRIQMVMTQVTKLYTSA